jgi:hypothetical protein
MLAGTSSHVAACPDLGPTCAGPHPPTPFWHHVQLVTADVGLDVSYGVTPWLAVEARLGVRVVDTTPRYSELDGTPKLVPDDPHHHDETIVGPTDPWLVLRFAAARNKLISTARLGVTLPLGSTVPNPYLLGDEGKWHEHTQLGTGTFVPIVGLGLSYSLGPIDLDVSTLGLFSAYANSKGYRAPSRFFPAFRVTLPLLGGALRPYLAAEISAETGERWDGRPGAEGSDGRADLLAGGGLAWRFQKAWRVDLGVRVHAAALAGGAAFEYPGIVQLGLGTDFDVKNAEPQRAPR